MLICGPTLKNVNSVVMKVDFSHDSFSKSNFVVVFNHVFSKKF